MDSPSRRNFLKDLGLGIAAIPAAERAQAAQLPGAPPSSGTDSQASHPANIMAIAAHPGDAFFAMGAAVALQVHLGGQGVFLSLSLGGRGSAKIAPPEYSVLQQQSAERAAQMLGARAEFLTYPDGEVPDNEEVKLRVCDLIREHKSDIIVTHWQGTWHKDHKACYNVVNDAVFYASLPALARAQPAHPVKKVFFNDNWEDANGFLADTYLDITPVFDRWMEACAVFPMWRGENGFRYNDYYRSLAVGRGCLSNSQYAIALMSSPDQFVRHVHSL
jgi:LmbE family N-acetylglucosaminyl deacetylase